jgi:hypothetical protein
VVLLGALVLTWPSSSTRGPLSTAGQLVLHLTPVLLLTTAFPLVDSEISSARIGGVSLTSVVLASSMTVPWLSQSVCMPLYRGIGDTLHRPGRDALLASFCRAWPLIALRSLSVVALFAVPVQLVLGWPLQVLGAYLVLTVLHLLFVQLLVLTNRPDHRGLWAAAWTAGLVQSRQTGRLTCADAVVERLRSGAKSEPSRRQTDRQVVLTCEGVEHSPCRWGHRGGTGARLAGAGSPSPQVRPGKADFAAALG